MAVFAPVCLISAGWGLCQKVYRKCIQRLGYCEALQQVAWEGRRNSHQQGQQEGHTEQDKEEQGNVFKPSIFYNSHFHFYEPQLW